MINLNDFNGHSQITITPDFARYLLENTLYEHQRPLRKDHVKMLAGEINKKTFLPGTDIHFARLGDKLYLIDGQHTLNAISASSSVMLTVITHFVNTYDEIMPLYYVIDRGLKRGIGDILSGVELQIEMSNTRNQNIVAATKQIYSGFSIGGDKSQVSSITNQIDWLRKWQQYGKMFFDSVQFGDKKVAQLVKKAGILGVGLVTFKYQPVKAEDFWHQVVYDDGLNHGDPRKTFQKWVLNNKAIGGYISGRHTTMREFALYTNVAWTAYCEGRELKMLKVNDRKARLTIYGTPYDSGIDGYGI